MYYMLLCWEVLASLSSSSSSSLGFAAVVTDSKWWVSTSINSNKYAEFSDILTPWRLRYSKVRQTWICIVLRREHTRPQVCPCVIEANAAKTSRTVTRPRPTQMFFSSCPWRRGQWHYLRPTSLTAMAVLSGKLWLSVQHVACHVQETTQVKTHF